jgi:hypothetical protein
MFIKDAFVDIIELAFINIKLNLKVEDPVESYLK